MAEIIHLHKQKEGLKPRERTFVAVGGGAEILMFTGVRYERDISDLTPETHTPESTVSKPRGKRITSR